MFVTKFLAVEFEVTLYNSVWKVRNPESTADHSLRIRCKIICVKGINLQKYTQLLAKLAL